MANLADKVEFLSRPSAYRGATAHVEARETRMSWIFLTDQLVYKLKKPVRLPYLDFSTQGRRHHFCDEELRLNARLAAETYREVLALRRDSAGNLTLSGRGRVVDWLVVMRRLPEEAMLESRILAGLLEPSDVTRVGDRLAGFYAGCRPEIADGGAYLRHLLEEQEINRRYLEMPELGVDAEARPCLDRIERAFERMQPEIEERISAGHIVEGHGDLRPEHVCLVEPLQIIDCLEFNRAMRLIDPYDEVNYLGLECAILGAPEIGPALLAIVDRRLGARPSSRLLAVYSTFRCLLRARLSLVHLLERPVRKPGKWMPLTLRYLAEARSLAPAIEAPRDR